MYFLIKYSLSCLHFILVISFFFSLTLNFVLGDVKSLSTLENDSGMFHDISFQFFLFVFQLMYLFCYSGLKALTSLDLPPELSGGSALSHPCEVMPPHTSLSQLQDYAIPNIIPKSNNYTFSLLFVSYNHTITHTIHTQSVLFMNVFSFVFLFLYINSQDFVVCSSSHFQLKSYDIRCYFQRHRWR